MRTLSHQRTSAAAHIAIGLAVLISTASACGKSGSKAASAPPPTPSTCGDGVRSGAEHCDDGNTASGDGCSQTCTLEDASALCAGTATASGSVVVAERVASGLSRPVHVAAAPLDPRRLFVVEQAGTVRVFVDGVLRTPPFLDIRSLVGCCGERGLLSIAFDPNYAGNRRFFVNYTDRSGATVVARYARSATDPDRADAASGTVLFTIAQPFGNHNGGQVAFGSDGMLYVGMGDGGGGGDPRENAQDNTALLGKMLRVNVSVDTAPFYRVPADNPSPGAPGLLGLVWAKGLRNPFRFSFDRSSGELYIGDVGQNAIEEIDVVNPASSAGANFGWDIFEGSACFEPDPAPDCPNPVTEFIAPVIEYPHPQGCSVTGGFVYRGCAMPDLHGTYFYSDFCSAFLRSFRFAGGAAQDARDRTAEVAPGGGLSVDSVSSFGEDARGEIYIADYGGEIFRLVAGP